MARVNPPRKTPAKPTGPRRIRGRLWDVATAAQELGETEKSVRAQVARGVLPHRRMGGRIVFLLDEVQEFLRGLPGVSAAEAHANVVKRNGGERTR